MNRHILLLILLKIFSSKYPYDSLNLKLLKVINLSDSVRSVSNLNDTTIMVPNDSLDKLESTYSRYPFKNQNQIFQGDSIKSAVTSLLKYLDDRDSTIVSFTGVGNTFTHIMMNSKPDKVIRYWLKNEFSDSVTIWIANPSRNTIALYLEQGVNFRRPVQQHNYSKAKIDLQLPDNSKLLSLQNIFIRPQYWKFRKETSFILSQAALSNWVQGGENSISTSLDATCYADYNNVALKLSSNNFIRLNLGFLKLEVFLYAKMLICLRQTQNLTIKHLERLTSALLCFLRHRWRQVMIIVLSHPYWFQSS